MSEQAQGHIIVTLASTEKSYEYDKLSVTFESSDQEILDALQPVLLEDEGFNIKDEQEDGYYTLKRVESSKNIYVFPKSTAGVLLSFENPFHAAIIRYMRTISSFDL